MRRNISVPVILILFSLMCFPAWAQNQDNNRTLTINSFLPAPHANVQTLWLNPHNEPAGACQIGRIYINTSGNLLICKDNGSGIGAYSGIGGAWTQNGNNVYPTNTPTNANIVVGIGTSTPEEKLHMDSGNLLVSGSPAVTGKNSILYYNTANDRLLIGDHDEDFSDLKNVSLGDHSVAIGSQASADGNHAIALGNKATADGDYSVVLGAGGTTSSTAINSVLINLDNDITKIPSPTITAPHVLSIMNGKVGIGVTNPGFHLELPLPTWEVDTNDGLNQLFFHFYEWVTDTNNDTLHTVRNNFAFINPFFYAVESTPLYFWDMEGFTVFFSWLATNSHTIPFRHNQHPNVLDNRSRNTTGIASAMLWMGYSDKRFKTNLRPIENALGLINQLKPVKYNWLKSTNDNEGNISPTPFAIKEDHLGLLAQDVYKVIPEVVFKPEDENKKQWSIAYDELTPVLIQAIKEHKAETDALKKRIEDLEKRLESMTK